MLASVIDTSALAAVVFGEPGADEVVRALNGPIAAPALLWFEMASVCFAKIRSHPSKREELLRAFSLAFQLPIKVVEVRHDEIVDLALRTGLTTYDATFLWLARCLSAELVTLDERLHRAASQTKT